jgi:hypothetical protein
MADVCLPLVSRTVHKSQQFFGNSYTAATFSRRLIVEVEVVEVEVNL